MVRKTREELERERQAQARADLVRAARGGRRFGRVQGILIHDLETDQQIREARKAGENWTPRMPVQMEKATYILLAVALAFVGYIIIRYSL